MAGRAPTRSIEKELWARGHEMIVGVDEVGRGAWAGPLMVGAAVLPRDKRVNGVRSHVPGVERIVHQFAIVVEVRAVSRLYDIVTHPSFLFLFLQMSDRY